MLDIAKGSIQGFLKIKDKDTGEILVDTHNDVLYGNISATLAHALIGNPNSVMYYLAFGNGAAYIGPTGIISYKPSLGGSSSLIKMPYANLYNTVYAKQLTNDSSVTPDSTDIAYIGSEDYSTNYEDIIIDVTLGYNEPPTGLNLSTTLQQTSIDNSTFIGTTTPSTASTFDPTTLVFNEIALFAGTPNIFPGEYTTTTTEVTSFINQTMNFSNVVGTQSKAMLTHAIFHPVQKSANRAIEVIYTLRIQMGVSA